MTPSARRGCRCAVRGAVCAVVTAALLVLPVEIRPTPDAGPLLGSQPAAAETTPTITVTTGNAHDCATTLTNGVGWQATDSGRECEIVLPACPASPLHGLNSGVFMRLSSPPARLDGSRFPSGFRDVDQHSYAAATEAVLPNYPDFCELRVIWDDPDSHHTACSTNTSHVVRRYAHTSANAGEEDCRLLRPLACPVGLQFVTSKTCRGIQRRDWSCATGVKHVRFGECIAIGDDPATDGNHPACGAGAPHLPLISCEQYVGGDFFESPQNIDCVSTYPTETPVSINGLEAIPGAFPAPILPNTLTGSAAHHWCRYFPQYLRADCHGSVRRGCDTFDEALCLKRGSGVGGCAAIAQIIRCRALLQAYIEEVAGATLDYVRKKSCTPCVALPFQPISERCPADTKGSAPIGFPESDGGHSEHYLMTAVHERRGSAQDHECQDPPSGRLEWSSSHESRLAVVNAAVVFTLEDLDLEQFHWYDQARFEVNSGFAGTYILGSSFPMNEVGAPNPATDNPPLQVRYSHDPAGRRGDPSHDRRIKTWRPAPDRPTGYTWLQDMTSDRECIAQAGPTFRLIVRELWPDSGGTGFVDADPDCTLRAGASVTGDADAIQRLFGDDALGWWCRLGDSERKQMTAARGVEWWPDVVAPLSTAQDVQAAEQERDTAMTTTLPCAFGIKTWILDGGGFEVPQESEIWCHWVPRRPGYYEVHAGGAWPMRKVSLVENAAFVDSDGNPSQLRHLVDFLNAADTYDSTQLVNGKVAHDQALFPGDAGCASVPDHAPAPTWGECRRAYIDNVLTDADSAWTRMRNVATRFPQLPRYSWTLSRTWENMGIGFTGVGNSVSVTPIADEDTDNKYQAAANPQAVPPGCPSIDLRVLCSLGDVIDYTETKPIGIIVHEVRTVTRAPS